MKRNFLLKRLPVVLIISALVITAVAWQGQPGKTTRTISDTIPDRNKKIKSIDDALEQLEKSKEELKRTLDQKDWNKEMNETLDKVHFDSEKMKQEIEEAVKSIDAKKIQDEVQKAMKEVDLQKMKIELQQNMDKVDLQQMKDEIAKAIKDVDVEKIKSEIDASISKIDMDNIKKELDKVKEIDFKGVEENLKKIGPEIEKSMQNAKESIEKAKKELLEYKNFIDGLDKDGLIDKNKNYTIEYKRGELTINGKKQSAEVVKKYSNFLKDRKDFTIKKDEDNFNIDND
jgi:DNA repair exonuclease SbcCD ATPase subunit